MNTNADFLLFKHILSFMRRKALSPRYIHPTVKLLLSLVQTVKMFGARRKAVLYLLLMHLYRAKKIDVYHLVGPDFIYFFDALSIDH